MKIWTLTIDPNEGFISTQVFRTETEAFAELREWAINNVSEEARDMSDDELPDYLSERAVYYLDEHSLPDSSNIKEEGWVVVNNITGLHVSKVFDSEDNANRLCGAMNLDAGPGGLYGVKRAD